VICLQAVDLLAIQGQIETVCGILAEKLFAHVLQPKNRDIKEDAEKVLRNTCV
jgi:hypothetical protein